MKKLDILSVFLFLLITIFVASCEDKNDDGNGAETEETEDQKKNRTDNEWIYEQMETYYLWNDKMPTKANLDFTIVPDGLIEIDKNGNNGFFDQLLFKKYRADAQSQSFYDKFSEIEQYTASQKSTGSNDLGFDFIGMKKTETDIVLIVTYVKPGTINANDVNGMRRGYIIGKVDGQILTSSNWFSALYQNKSTYEIEYYKNATDLLTGKQPEKYSLKVTSDYEENPTLIDTVYQDINGHRIGYMLFNTYGTGSSIDDNIVADNVKMIEALDRFQQAGVTDLVLDLRYNSGGLVQTGIYLGSALVPNRDVNAIYEKKVYNPALMAAIEKYSNKDEWLYDKFVNNIYRYDANGKIVEILNKIPNLGDQLQSLTIIGIRYYTASCSEMTINCLRPYYKGKKIYLVLETDDGGTGTIGKNVGSWEITPSNNKDIKWKLQPITFRSYNVENESDYFDGFRPDVIAYDFGSEQLALRTGLKALGSLDEEMLATAVAKITGKARIQKTEKTTTSTFTLKHLPRSENEKVRSFGMIENQYKSTVFKKQLLESNK